MRLTVILTAELCCFNCQLMTTNFYEINVNLSHFSAWYKIGEPQFVNFKLKKIKI